MTTWRKYLLWFAQEHIDFRHAEIESLLKLWNIQYRPTVLPDSKSEVPYWILELPNEDSAKTLASRSISLRCIIELWTNANNFSQFHSNLSQYLVKEKLEIEKYFEKDKSFKITVETFNKHISQKEKVEKIETIHYLPVAGPVNLRDPDVPFWYIEYYGLDTVHIPENPLDILFGRWVADGRRNLINEISLKTRKFIGNTSMDPQLSLLMANQGLVKDGDFVLDPFCGTGSLLVSAAKFGGFVMGCDIDYMMLHGKSRPSRINQKVRDKDERIISNLRQYNCEDKYVDVLISDFSLNAWRDEIVFDSIITDPPYGIREATEKIESKASKKSSVLQEDAVHYPSTSRYNLHQLVYDLLKFSAKHLKMNGRLVFWYPVHKNDYTDSSIPKHHCLKLVANSEQPLAANTARRLLTYEKISENYMDQGDEEIDIAEDFSTKYFLNVEKTRHEKKKLRLQLKENGKKEAIRRGKILDESGKVIDPNFIS